MQAEAALPANIWRMFLMLLSSVVMNARLSALTLCLASAACSGSAPDTFPLGLFTITLAEANNTCGLDSSGFQTGQAPLQITDDGDDDYTVQLNGSSISPDSASTTTLIFDTPDSTFNAPQSDGSTCTYDEVDVYTLSASGNTFSGVNQATLSDPTGTCNGCVINYDVTAVKISN